ncbi:MAG: tripartite tricarboxylate transporter substrate binding protein [Clostridiales bacterium]|nr:tripartite tricarboxylate transporter substrate binding protein [Clostridiales bacterium]
MKKTVFILMLAVAAAFSGACADNAQKPAYPAKNINAIVQWGAGGGTDSLMRPLAALAEQELGAAVVVQNMPGATGSIAAQYVYDAPADGYLLLMGAENPALYKELGISGLTYADFDCVFLIGDETTGIVVRGDSPFNSFGDIVAQALDKPESVKLSTTGKGGLPWEMGAFIKDVTGAAFKQIPYDSDASARNAVLSGECDFTVCKVQSGLEYHKDGALKFLCMFSLKTVPVLPNIPLITAEYPDFARYLPWGPFYGVFVKQGTDPAVAQKLSEAFTAAAQSGEYTEVLANFNVNYLGLSGNKAKEYIDTWQANTLQALKNSGALNE